MGQRCRWVCRPAEQVEPLCWSESAESAEAAGRRAGSTAAVVVVAAAVRCVVVVGCVWRGMTVVVELAVVRRWALIGCEVAARTANQDSLQSDRRQTQREEALALLDYRAQSWDYNTTPHSTERAGRKCESQLGQQQGRWQPSVVTGQVAVRVSERVSDFCCCA